MSKEDIFKRIEEEAESQEGSTDKKRHPLVSVLWGIFDFIKTVAVIVVIAFTIRIFIIQPFIVEGQSMEPGLKNNDYLITEKLTYRFREPARGDVVIFHPPDNPSVNYIKRVIGLPGDKIEVKDDEVYVNSIKLNESYLAGSADQAAPGRLSSPVMVADNEYYVMGDNRDHSRDSREIGSIPKQNVVSHVWFRLLPPNSISTFAKVNYNPSP